MATVQMQNNKEITVSPIEMEVVEKMKKGYWATSTYGMGYMWHIKGSILDHKVSDEEYNALQTLKSKGIVG